MVSSPVGLWEKLIPYPALTELTKACLCDWPDHTKFLTRSFDHPDVSFMNLRNNLGNKVQQLIDRDLYKYCSDYRWTCAQVKEEQIFFHRHGHYRLSNLSEAIAQVYGVPEYMERYVNGLLLSQVFWQNHAYAFYLYQTRFLPGNRPGYDHLEVGPGHGLFAAVAGEDPNCRSVTAWDVSPSSLQATALALRRLGMTRPVALVERDVVGSEPTPDAFDSIVMSELLEHLENPHRALRVAYRSLRPGGRIFLNVPVNSPALDHLFLWHDAEEVRGLVRDTGFDIVESWELPVTGQTLESARRLRLDISCVMIGHKRD